MCIYLSVYLSVCLSIYLSQVCMRARNVSVYICEQYVISIWSYMSFIF